MPSRHDPLPPDAEALQAIMDVVRQHLAPQYTSFAFFRGPDNSPAKTGHIRVQAPGSLPLSDGDFTSIVSFQAAPCTPQVPCSVFRETQLLALMAFSQSVDYVHRNAGRVDDECWVHCVGFTSSQFSPAPPAPAPVSAPLR